MRIRLTSLQGNPLRISVVDLVQLQRPTSPRVAEPVHLQKGARVLPAPALVHSLHSAMLEFFQVDALVSTRCSSVWVAVEH